MACRAKLGPTDDPMTSNLRSCYLLSVALACCSKPSDGTDDRRTSAREHAAKADPDMKRSDATEAAEQLNEIGKLAKRYFGDTSSFPVGESKLLPSSGGFDTCCGDVKRSSGTLNKCAARPEEFKSDRVWSELKFSMAESSSYRYRYVGTANTFTAYAIGDADCDGTVATFTLTGDVVDGNPSVTLTKPPPGVR